MSEKIVQLNELLEKEAEQLTQAARYERSEARHGYRRRILHQKHEAICL